jgi:hypothetical protein
MEASHCCKRSAKPVIILIASLLWIALLIVQAVALFR